MLDPLITQELIKGIVLELGSIVALDSLDCLLMLALHLIAEVDEGLLGLTFVLEEVDPVVVDDHQAILLPSKTVMRWRTKEIQMKELQDPLG